MARVKLDNKGLASVVSHPCVKAEGLCRLRTTAGEFQCIFDPGVCKYKVRRKKDVAEG